MDSQVNESGEELVEMIDETQLMKSFEKKFKYGAIHLDTLMV